MKSTILAALLASAAFIAPMHAHAQTASDVIVMRRVIAPPQARPASSPSSSPDPTPVPTPGPTPQPSPPPPAPPTWVAGEWTGPTTGCGDLQLTRAVTCVLSGRVTDNAACADPSPETTRTVSDFSACGYSWEITGHGEWSSTCSVAAMRETLARCVRQDGATAEDERCAGQPKPVPETAEVFTGCTFAWSLGDWSAYSSTCSTSAARSRTAECRRSDGTVAADENCGAKPDTTETASVLSGCTFAAVNWSGWNYASTCSGSTSRAQTAQCGRSDGTIVDGAECTSHGIPVVNTDTGVQNFASCSYRWAGSGYMDPGASCTPDETWTQAVTCRRDIDGAAVADARCDPSTKPPAAQSGHVDYSGCSYAGGPWSGYTYASQCSVNTSMTRTRPCVRSDGTTVGDSLCTDRGIAVSETVGGQQNLASCSYNWATSAYTDPGASCTSNEVWTRTVWCKRDADSVGVADSYCNPSLRPASTDSSHADYSGCTGTWSYGDWTDTSACVNGQKAQSSTATCSPAGQCDPGTRPATRTQFVNCVTPKVTCNLQASVTVNQIGNNLGVGTASTYSDAVDYCQGLSASARACLIYGTAAPYTVYVYPGGTVKNLTNRPEYHGGMCTPIGS